MQLFTTRPHSFTKVAATKLLGDNPERWPGELLSELHRTNSYLGSYQVDFQVQGQDEERGYLHGYFLVTNGQPPANPNPMGGEIVNQTTAQAEQGAMQDGGAPLVKIPVIVENRNLKAMDVFLNAEGGFLPLSEDRVGEALAQPENFQSVRVEKPSAVPLPGTEPPSGSGRQFGSGQASVEKTSSVLESVVGDLHPKIKTAFLKRLETPEMIFAIENNEAFKEACGKLWHTKTASAPQPAYKSLKPDAVHFEKTAGGYMMRSAAAGAYHPDEEFIPRSDADMIPYEILCEIQKEGSVLLTDGIDEKEVTPNEKFELVKEAGLYSAVAGDDYEIGFFTPEIYDLDGSRRHGVLGLTFSRGASTVSLSHMSKVAASRLDPSSNDAWGAALAETIHTSQIVGEGVFVKIDKDKIAAATVPLKITSRTWAPTGMSFQFENGFRGGTIKLASILKAPMQTGADEYTIPGNWFFVPVTKNVSLVEDPELAKAASPISGQRESVIVGHSNGLYSIKGHLVNGLPTSCTDQVKEASASLLLGCLGLSAKSVKTKLAQAKLLGYTEAWCPGSVADYKEKLAEMRDVVRECFEEVTLPSLNLIKEASVLTDETSVDTILSLGFISPETIGAYVEHVDEMEGVLGKLCEMVVSVRLGLKDIPEQALERAIKGLDATLAGLRDLQLRMGEEEAV